jgi:hypothetical protein
MPVWCNGKRGGFKIRWPKGRVGSSPITGTKISCKVYARVVELVDTPDLGSGVERRGGSNPLTGTKFEIVYE